MGLGLHIFFLQLFCQCRSSDLQGVHLHHRLGDGIVGFQHPLQLVLAHIASQLLDKGFGMAVLFFQCSRLFQRAEGTNRISEHCIDKAWSEALLFAVPLCQVHGFIHRSGLGDLVQKIDLIKAQVQNIPHRRMQILQFAAEQLLQIVIQQPPVLQHTVAQPRTERCIPPIQPIPGHIFFQYAVGPGCLFPAGDQSAERGFSSRHTYASKG